MAASLIATTSAWAADDIYLAWQGGSREKLMREKILPQFEKRFPGVKVNYFAAVSSKILARLRAQRGSEDIDVAMMDDGPVYQAGAEGLCSNQTPKYDRSLYPVANMDKANAIGVGVVATGIEYNTKKFKEMGWAPPTSWKDLEDPKYKGQLGLLSISNTFGLHTLMMMSAANGGSGPLYEAGFKSLRDKVSLDVQAFVESTGTLASAFQTGEISIAVNSNGRTLALAESGFPVEFVYPKEGAVATVVGACVVQKPKVSPHSVELVKFLLTPEIQSLLANDEGLSPVNKEAKLTPETMKKIPHGEAAMAKLAGPS